MGFTAHIDNAIDRIRVRQNILKMMGGSTWGSESNILRVPRKALLGSVVSHGFVAVGSGAYYKDLRKLDTCALNPAARAIAGIGFSARLATLHSSAETRNMFIQSCA